MQTMKYKILYFWQNEWKFEAKRYDNNIRYSGEIL